MGRMPGTTPRRARDKAPLWPGPPAHQPAGTGGAARRGWPSYVWRRFTASPLVRALLILVVVSTVATAFAYERLASTLTNYPGTHFNHGQNAIWLEHTWAGDFHTPEEYGALAAMLSREQVRYVFVHVGPLESDGTIPTSRAYFAYAFVHALHRNLPGIRVLAWIGQEEAASGLPADQVVNLADPAERTRIASTASAFVQQGFDGIHYDIEPIENNSTSFIELLTATRTALPVGAILSVAAEKWAPNAHVASWAYAIGRGGSWWTTYYYALVAQHVDQLVVMAYNTGMPTANLYSLFVKQETQNILTAAQTASHPPQVLIGLPTYTQTTATFWYHPGAETISSGLAGVTAGLDSLRDSRAFAGIALYRFGTTSQGEWTTYSRQWLGT